MERRTVRYVDVRYGLRLDRWRWAVLFWVGDDIADCFLLVNVDGTIVVYGVYISVPSDLHDLVCWYACVTKLLH